MRKAKGKPPAALNIEVDGRTYSITYTITGRTMTVTMADGRHKATQLGALQPEWVARDLVRSILQS